jgi:PAS domain S-box-containing protein
MSVAKPSTPSDDRRYRLLVEAVTDYAIYFIDPSGFVTSWNAGAKRFKGYDAQEIIGQHFSRFYTEPDRDLGLPQRALRIAQEKGSFETEGWRLRKDGSRFWAHVVLDPIRTENGTLIGFAKVTRDLTERRASEMALRRSEERFKLLVQGVTDYAIYMLDRDGTVTNWNEGARRIKGYLETEIVGQHFSLFYTPEDRERGEPERALASAAREGRFETEAIRVRQDGSRFIAHVVVDPIKDDSGQIIGFAKITRDITEKREAQRALEDAKEKLVQAQKMEALGTLTGGIAHDFNNLLMAVLGSLQLLRKRLPADDVKAFRILDNAVAGAKRGAGLIQRMLAFARRQELKIQSVHLPSLIDEMRDLLGQALGPKIDLTTRYVEELPPVLADANQLETALLNLVVNARDAMPAGGSVIIAAEQSGDGKQVRLRVTDSGAGMDEATLRRAAEPFFTTKGGKGTGLGLSMVHGLVEQHGGRLHIESRLGLGTSIELDLPVASEPPSEQMPTPSHDMPPVNRQRILIVDDDPLVLESAVVMLEDLGHEVQPATSGKEAEEYLGSREWDLLITDYAMPRMTGLELMAVTKLRWPKLPVLLMTGYAEIDDGKLEQQKRLSKPFDQQALAFAIAAVT